MICANVIIISVCHLSAQNQSRLDSVCGTVLVVVVQRRRRGAEEFDDTITNRKQKYVSWVEIYICEIV